MRPFPRLTAIVLCILGSASCSGSPNGAVTPAAERAQFAGGLSQRSAALQTPALLGVNEQGALVYWPITNTGGRHPQTVTQLGTGVSDMAVDGNTVVMSTNGVLLYNVTTQQSTSLPDPDGTPGYVAVDKNANIYVANKFSTASGNVVMYSASTHQPNELQCSLMGFPTGLAVDNEGDIFINGYGPKPAAKPRLIEIPMGPNGPDPAKCFRVSIEAETNTGGVAIDPQTDALIVVDNPKDCATIGGRFTIYSKPYNASTGVPHQLSPGCARDVRVNASSTRLFVYNSNAVHIEQRSYPDGKSMGVYANGDGIAFTPLPAKLPN